MFELPSMEGVEKLLLIKRGGERQLKTVVDIFKKIHKRDQNSQLIHNS